MKFPFDEVVAIEVPVVNTTQRQIRFPDSPKLRGKTVSYYRLAHGSRNPSGKFNYQQDNINFSTKGCYLVLKSGDNEAINRLYIPTIQDLIISDNEIFLGKSIDVQKCYIEVTSEAQLSTNSSFLFYFFVINQTPTPKPVIPKRMDFLEIPFSEVGQTRIYFPDDIKLRGKKITEILVPVSGGISPSGAESFNPYFDTLTNLKNAFITLFDTSGNKIVDSISYPEFVLGYRAYSLLYFNRLVIDWPNSYIEQVGFDSTDEGKVFLFNIVHEEK